MTQKITPKIQRIEIKNTDDALRLDHVIQKYAESHNLAWSNAYIRELIKKGLVFLARRQERKPMVIVASGQRIEIYVQEQNVKKRDAIESTPKNIRILYHDESILCIDKPAGLPAQPTLDRKRDNAFDLIKAQLNLKYLGMHHRLDRDTSGVLLFTVDPSANAGVAEQFSKHLCEKTYVAVVHGTLKKHEGRIESFLTEVNRRGKQAVYGSVKSGGKKAITDYLVLSQKQGRTLVEVKITTGRTHQIRVHFSELGHPIVGDTLYGSPVGEFNRLGRFLLHAHSLTIRHPVTQNLVRIESPIPEDFRL